MNIKREKLVILLILGLIFPILITNNINFSDKQTTAVKNPKSSGGYTPTFIHIDGSITDNWTDTLSQPWCYDDNGIYVIENVTINASNSPTGSGILINNSKNEYFIIRNCTVFNADNSFHDSGIWLENTNNGTITNNNCSNNNLGIYLLDCDGNNITENTANNNENNGIYLDTNCVNNNITGNTANENNHFGIQLVWNCDDNNITLNTVNNNVDYGIYINSFGGSCDNNIVLNNTANENNRHGIFIRYNNYDNSIINNTANDNIRTGIYLHNSNDINVTGNKINNNTRGIDAQNCDSSNILNNTIISSLEMGINLEFSDNNEIKNNTINRNDLGLRIDNSDYNNITGNILLDNSWCIYETDCEGNIIEYNDCSTPTVELPIYIDDYATGVGANNWTWAKSQTWCSGSGTDTDPYIIQNLRISGFGIIDGISIQNSNVSFIIQGCAIYNSLSGIFLDNVNNSLLIDNNCSDNLDYGIFLENDCYYNNITENTCNDNDDGIYLNVDCNSTIISGNTLNYNDYGIVLSYCGHNNITENIVKNNTNNGIKLESFCDYNIIMGNNLDMNGLGIEIYEESDFNIVVGNTVDNNTYGIYLQYNSYNNTIMGNTIKNCEEQGILLEDDCDDNEFTDNVIYNNNLGIEVASGVDNSFYKNFFLENGKHAIDDGTDNKWNSTTIGNYWDNYSETHPNLAIDADDNGIGDVPYNISFSPLIQDHLPIVDDVQPTIIIDLPTPGSIFGKMPPSFNVRITDVYLYEMWYSFDGGLHTYKFTENGTIEQSAWDVVYNAIHTLTFYASDKPGNIGTADVMIIKDYTPPIININSPTYGDAFSNNAPSFNVNITEDYLVSMWYTIDGGLHNYTFTANTNINQTRWDAMSDGAITLSFYAIDDLGYIGTASVNIIKDTVAPVIIITSPAEGETFGNTAPLFNITIIEVNPDEMWYSFDGGLTNYTIVNNGTFDQTTWTALSQGDVTITFYARDLAGHDTSESVAVIKSVPSGLDPGLIITIVIVSIVGGVAVISVVYIFMKKRVGP